MKQFDSTEELYGVSPKVLANMTYKNALETKKQGLLKRKRRVADEMFLATDYDTEVAPLQVSLKKVTKALQLVDLQLEEIK